MAHAATSHTQCDMCEAFATHTKMKRHRPVGGSFLGGASLLGQASGKLHGSPLSSGCCVGCCPALATQDFLTRKRRFASALRPSSAAQAQATQATSSIGTTSTPSQTSVTESANVSRRPSRAAQAQAASAISTTNTPSHTSIA